MGRRGHLLNENVFQFSGIQSLVLRLGRQVGLRAPNGGQVAGAEGGVV